MDPDPPEQSNPDTQDRPSDLERVRAAVNRWCPAIASGLDLVAGVLDLSNSNSLAQALRLSAVALRAIYRFSGRSRK
ncbi:hypothetical protein [Nocardia tengchongensis]|uniref:hypothetical protein n=1 Tax=Nocardia tengchongensis TaxID=2055889 RepID=UPI003623D724